MVIKFNDELQNKEIEDLRKQEEEDLIEILAEAKYGVPPINLSVIPIDNDALKTISEKEAREMFVAPFKMVGKIIHIGVRSPSPENLERLKKYFMDKNYVPHFYMCSLASLEKAWDRFKEISYASSSERGSVTISGETLKGVMKEISNIEDVKRILKENQDDKKHTTSTLLEIAIAGAIKIDVSDLHFEPEENFVRLRFRLDGVLHDIIELKHSVHKLINSRIKLISGLKITNTSIAQDGRFSIFINESEINMRVSVMPGAYGESIVIRILNPEITKIGLEDLGIESDLYNLFVEEIKKPNGLILLTGPTGSGKTTTLYSFLQKIYSPEIKIITIENPIEYHLQGISQTQTDEDRGYTFLEGLRSALRQDPDVIMVGEIRDNETAKTAIDASLTGHLVFSTLHTNNAAGVIPRLISLGVPPKTLVSSLSLSIAQRLVRKLCDKCKKEKDPTEKELETILRIKEGAKKLNKDFTKYGIEETDSFKIYEAVGCEKCNNTGYKGRIGIFEIVKNNKDIEAIIPDSPSERQIKNIASLSGYLDMKEDGILKLLKGVTSYGEVRSVVDLYEE